VFSEPIPDEHHVARHVPKRLRGRQSGQDFVFPQAFSLREAINEREQERFLSMSWLEFFNGSHEEKLRQTVQEMRGYPRDLKPKDALALLIVGKIKELGGQRGQRLRVLHEPELPGKPAYSAIRGMKRDDTELLALIAADAVAEIVEINLIG